MMYGYPAFAPELAIDGNGFAPEVHDELARIEGSCFWFTGRNDLLRFALKKFFPAACSMLEVGCGTGFVMSGILNEKPEMRVVGGELFFTGLLQAGARLPDAELLQMDACHIPYADEFDVAGAFDVLEHIDEDQCALGEMFGAVKKGGGIIVTVPQHPCLWSLTDELACHKRRYTSSDLRAKIEAAGFRIGWITSYMTLVLPGIIISRIKSSSFPSKAVKNAVLEALKIPPVVNTALDIICKFERGLLYRGMTLPLGGSLLCVALKD
jgi:SAM-dependent methyltransferase